MQGLWPNGLAHPMIPAPPGLFPGVRKSPHTVLVIVIGFPLQDAEELKLGKGECGGQCRSPTVRCWGQKLIELNGLIACFVFAFQGNLMHSLYPLKAVSFF